MVSEQIVVAAVFCSGQVFVFCRLINKNMLEWFLLIIKLTLNRSTNFFSRNHPTLCFWLTREGWQMPSTEQLLYQTEKTSHWMFSIRTLFLKILQYSRGNTCVKFWITWLLLNWLHKVIVLSLVSGLHLKPSRLSDITKIPVAFKPEL